MDYQRFHDGAALARLHLGLEWTRPDRRATLWPAHVDAHGADDPTVILSRVDSTVPGCVPPPPTTSPHGVAPEPTRATAAGRHRRPRRRLLGGWTLWRA